MVSDLLAPSAAYAIVPFWFHVSGESVSRRMFRLCLLRHPATERNNELLVGNDELFDTAAEAAERLGFLVEHGHPPRTGGLNPAAHAPGWVSAITVLAPADAKEEPSENWTIEKFFSDHDVETEVLFSSKSRDEAIDYAIAYQKTTGVLISEIGWE